MACTLVCAAFVYTSCTKDLQNDIADLGTRLDKVENSLTSLENQIKEGAVITGVSATADGTGVVVTLSDGDSFTLNHGQKGDKGDKGDQGIQGVQGEKGEQGEKGDKGDQGAQGIQGLPGENEAAVVTIGENGNWFINGVDTNKPARGEKGDKGDPGTNGTTAPMTPTVLMVKTELTERPSTTCQTLRRISGSR